MPISSEFKPISTTARASQLIYRLIMIQEPISGREFSTAKRLITPQPVVAMKIYAHVDSANCEQKETTIDAAEGLQDVTSRILSQFYLRVSIKETTSEGNDLLYGTKFVSGGLYHFPSPHNTSPKEASFVFAFHDLGIIRKGQYSLVYELFKHEGFAYLAGQSPTTSVPHLTKVGQLNAARKLNIQGIREYYKDEVKSKYQQSLTKNFIQLAQNQEKFVIYKHLKHLKIIRDSQNLDDLSVYASSFSSPSLSPSLSSSCPPSSYEGLTTLPFTLLLPGTDTPSKLASPAKRPQSAMSVEIEGPPVKRKCTSFFDSTAQLLATREPEIDFFASVYSDQKQAFKSGGGIVDLADMSRSRRIFSQPDSEISSYLVDAIPTTGVFEAKTDIMPSFQSSVPENYSLDAIMSYIGPQDATDATDAGKIAQYNGLVNPLSNSAFSQGFSGLQKSAQKLDAKCLVLNSPLTDSWSFQNQSPDFLNLGGGELTSYYKDVL